MSKNKELNKYMLISPDEIKKTLTKKKWTYKQKIISKKYKFHNYMDSIDFVYKIAELSERINHHPDLNIGYCILNIQITSHDLGGVSTKCINLANSIDNLYNKLGITNL